MREVYIERGDYFQREIKAYVKKQGGGQSKKADVWLKFKLFIKPICVYSWLRLLKS